MYKIVDFCGYDRDLLSPFERCHILTLRRGVSPSLNSSDIKLEATNGVNLGSLQSKRNHDVGVHVTISSYFKHLLDLFIVALWLQRFSRIKRSASEWWRLKFFSLSFSLIFFNPCVLYISRANTGSTHQFWAWSVRYTKLAHVWGKLRMTTFDLN